MHKTQLIISIAKLIIDYCLVVVAFGLAYIFRDEWNSVFLVPFSQFLVFALIAALMYVLIFAYLGLYTVDRKRGLTEQLFSLIVGSLSATMLAAAVIYFARSFDYSRLIVGLALVFSVVLVWVGRLVIVLVERQLHSRGIGVVNVLLVGGGSALTTTIRGFKAQDGYELVGIVPTKSSNEEGSTVEGVKVLDTFHKESFRSLLKEKDIHEVILADTSLGQQESLAIINACEQCRIRFRYIPDMFDVVTARLVSEVVAGMPVIELRPTLLEGWMVVSKRLSDVILATLGLIVISPIFLTTAFLIRLTSNGPVFFRHRRVGQNGVEFEVIKFRSMAMLEKDGKLVHSSENKEVEKLKEKNSNYKLENDPRITKIGHFIRKTSIDELPQLWNVLRGEMSLVGPRPYLAKELEKQQDSYPQTKSLVQRLLTVKPGITGLWQVSGRSNIEFTERVAMDAYYATHANFWMDIKILFQTLPAVVKGSGAM